MATKPKRPRDTNQLAKLIADIAMGRLKDGVMRYKPHELSLEDMRNLLKANEELSELVDSVDVLDEEHDKTPGKIILPFVSEEPVHEECWQK